MTTKKCPECGEEMVCIGEKFVRSELHIVPAQILVWDFYQKKYKCKFCDEDDTKSKIIKPEMPVPVIKKSMASAGTLANIIQQKYPRVPLKRNCIIFVSQTVVCDFLAQTTKMTYGNSALQAGTILESAGH